MSRFIVFGYSAIHEKYDTIGKAKPIEFIIVLQIFPGKLSIGKKKDFQKSFFNHDQECQS